MEITWTTVDAAGPAGPDPSGAAWQQSLAYGIACARLGSTVYRAVLTDAVGIVATAQLVGRRFLGVAEVVACTRGPVWHRKTTPDERAAAYRLLGRTAPVRLPGARVLTPDAAEEEAPALRAARLGRVMTAYTTAELDLAQPLDTLRAAQHGKWRNRLRRAESTDLLVTSSRFRPERDAWLLARESEQREARRYQAMPLPLVTEWARAAPEPDHLRIVTARVHGDPVAAMLFIVHGDTALYHIGWSDSRGRSTDAHCLTLWRATADLKRHGVRTLDLGGLNTGSGAGIARFKLGSGAVPRTLCGTWT